MVVRSFGERGYCIGGFLGVLLTSLGFYCSSFIHSPTVMFITYGLLYSFGSGLAYMAGLLALGKQFPEHHKYHMIVVTVFTFNFAAATVLFYPIVAWMLDNFGFPFTYRCMGIITFVVGTACCLSFLQLDDDNRGNVSRDRFSCTPSELHLLPESIIWVVVCSLMIAGYIMPFFHLGYFMEVKHISLETTATVMLTLCVAEAGAEVVMGLLGNRVRGHLVYFVFIGSSTSVVACLAWPVADVSETAIYIVAIGMGISGGLVVVYVYPVSQEVTQLPMDVAWSWTRACMGIGYIIEPLFTGMIYDIRYSYTDMFVVMAGVYFTVATLSAALIVLRLLRQRLRHRSSHGSKPHQYKLLSTECTTTFDDPLY